MKYIIVGLLLALTSAVQVSSEFRPPKQKELNPRPVFPTGDNEAEAYPEEFTQESIAEAEHELHAHLTNPKALY